MVWHAPYRAAWRELPGRRKNTPGRANAAVSAAALNTSAADVWAAAAVVWDAPVRGLSHCSVQHLEPPRGGVSRHALRASR